MSKLMYIKKEKKTGTSITDPCYIPFTGVPEYVQPYLLSHADNVA